MNIITEITEIAERLAKAEAELRDAQRKLRDVEGMPVIAAHARARFDLNDDFNVLQHKRKVTQLSEEVTRLNKKLSSVSGGGNGSGLKIEAGRNIEFEKNPETKATIIHADKDKWSSLSLTQWRP